MGAKATNRQVGPDIRGAWLRAMKMLDEEVKTKPSDKAFKYQGLSEILLKQIKENPLTTLTTISKFLPKELDVTATVEVNPYAKMTDEEWAAHQAARFRELEASQET